MDKLVDSDRSGGINKDLNKWEGIPEDSLQTLHIIKPSFFPPD